MAEESLSHNPNSFATLTVSNSSVNYKIHLWINGADLGEFNEESTRGDTVQIMSADHPMKRKIDDLPPIAKEDLFFVLRNGENHLKLEYEKINREQNKNRTHLAFALTRIEQITPIFYLAEKDTAKGTIVKSFFISPDRQPRPTVLGSADSGFIYLASRFKSAVVELNGVQGMSFGNVLGFQDLLVDAFADPPANALKKGQNLIRVKYEAGPAGDYSVIFATPEVWKVETKKLSEGERGSFEFTLQR